LKQFVHDHAITQKVRFQLPTEVAQVQFQLCLVGFVIAE
jgi:hypothetical protein